jgi:hypothetical protein
VPSQLAIVLFRKLPDFSQPRPRINPQGARCYRWKESLFAAAAGMSSLAASRADGYYHPPEWDPQKVGRDKYQGSKGSNQCVSAPRGLARACVCAIAQSALCCRAVCRWEQYGVIRFEMPYNIWCGGCGKHIRKGTRFNAKKKDVRTARAAPAS